MINLGNIGIKDIKLGDKSVKGVYLSDQLIFPTSTFNYEYVDLGLSVNWATCNIGANSPEEYGLYFAWGETTGYEKASDKSGGFTFNTTPYWASGTKATSTKWSKYTTNNTYSSTGIADNKLTLDPEDDTAHVNMGGDWRMPTTEEFLELYNACNTTWVTNYNSTGKNGRLFTLKTDSSKELFFPASGYADDSSVGSEGSYGYYWSSSLGTSYSYRAYCMSFNSSSVDPQNSGYYRNYGQSVRPVLPKT